jgi:hypothetical protein
MANSVLAYARMHCSAVCKGRCPGVTAGQTYAFAKHVKRGDVKARGLTKVLTCVGPPPNWSNDPYHGALFLASPGHHGVKSLLNPVMAPSLCKDPVLNDEAHGKCRASRDWFTQ